MLFFVVILFYFSYLRKIIKIYNGATEGLVQHTFVAIAEFSGIIVFNSYFRLAENTRLRSPQHPQAWERQAVKKPPFSIKNLEFSCFTIEIKPFKKALFLGY